MNPHMANFLLYLCGISFLACGSECITDDTSEKNDLEDRRPFSIEHIENGPEFLVNVPGIEKPLCFSAETKEETVRVLQDPKTGIVVNAQIFYDDIENKTYIDAILITKDNICIFTSQYVVLINNVRFNWGETSDFILDGHKVVVTENMISVTFRPCRITMVIQRHCLTQENYSKMGGETLNGPTVSNEKDGDSKEVTESENRPYALPVIGYEESASFINNFLSSKRRRGLFLQKFFGINKDRAVVRNVVIEVDSEGRKKRNNLGEGSSTTSNDGLFLDQNAAQENQQEQPDGQQHNEKDTLLNQQVEQQQDLQHSYSGQQRGSNTESRMKREAEKRRDSSIFLDMHISHFMDFSNRTHGLLGQFIYKNITREKIRYKDGKMTARLLVQGNPSHRTYAQFTSRYYSATNTTCTCWKIRHQGRDVLDGKYSDYVVPSIWYKNIKELPPPAPL